MADLLEHYLGLSLAKELRDADLAPLLQIQGVRVAAAQVESWLAFDLLECNRIRSRPGVWRGEIVFSVGCFSNLAPALASKSANQPWLLASQVRDFFEGNGKVVAVKDLDASGTPAIARLLVNEGSAKYQDEGASKRSGDVAGGVTGVHHVLITFTGQLTKF